MRLSVRGCVVVVVVVYNGIVPWWSVRWIFFFVKKSVRNVSFLGFSIRGWRRRLRGQRRVPFAQPVFVFVVFIVLVVVRSIQRASSERTTLLFSPPRWCLWHFLFLNDDSNRRLLWTKKRIDSRAFGWWTVQKATTPSPPSRFRCASNDVPTTFTTTTTKRRERKKRREFSGHRKKKTGVTTPKSEGKLKKGQNPKYTYILSSRCTLIKPKIKKPKRVPRGTVGTSDEGFGGLVGYDACLTRRRSSVRLRPEIQLFFCMCVRRQSERENIMQATFKLRAKSAWWGLFFYIFIFLCQEKNKSVFFEKKNAHIKIHFW